MRWRRNPRVLWRTVPGYLALAAVDGRTMEIEGPACDVWAQLERWVAEEDLTATLARDYAADSATVSADVRALLHELHAQGFVDRDL